MSNRKAAAAYLGVCVRTIRYWDSGRCRVPWSAVRVLRLLRAGELGGLLDGWDGWTLGRDALVSPEGRVYRERDMRHWWLMLEQGRHWRDAYERANPTRTIAAASTGSRGNSAAALDAPQPCHPPAAELVHKLGCLPARGAIDQASSDRAEKGGRGDRASAASEGAGAVALGLVSNGTSVKTASERHLSGGAP